MDHKKCAEIIMEEAHLEIGPGHICAGGNRRGMDSCMGDSGGPVLMPHKHRAFLVGLVSYGPEDCGLSPVPSVNVNVSFYLEWILDQLD